MTKLDTLLDRDGRDCHYCGHPLGSDITREHVVPQALGGPTRLDNLVLAHAKCNRKRGHRNEEHPGCEFCAAARAKYTTTIVSKAPLPRERVKIPWEDTNGSVYPGYGSVTYNAEAFGFPPPVGRDMLRKAGEWPGQQGC